MKGEAYLQTALNISCYHGCTKLALTGGECITMMDLISYVLSVHLHLTDISGRVVTQNNISVYELNPASQILQDCCYQHS